MPSSRYATEVQNRRQREASTVGGDGELVRGREAAGRLAWADAYAELSLADHSSSLAAEDLELLATAAYLLGHMEACLGALQRAEQLHAEAGESRRAARCALWLAFHLGSAGELAQAGGWLARANRLLEHEPPDCAERGHLLLPVAIQQIVAGDNAAAQELSARAAGIGRHAGDADLVALGCRSRAGPWCGWAACARPWPPSTRPWWR
jgi:hypothetical protein